MRVSGAVILYNVPIAGNTDHRHFCLSGALSFFVTPSLPPDIYIYIFREEGLFIPGGRDGVTKRSTHRKGRNDECLYSSYGEIPYIYKTEYNKTRWRAQELCESRGGLPGLSVRNKPTVSVDVKQHSTTTKQGSLWLLGTASCRKD